MEKFKKVCFFLIFLSLISAGCATTCSDRAIEQGARWGAVGAATGALVGVATKSHVGRGAAWGALIAGIPAMALEMVAPEAPLVAAPPPSPVHLPGPKEVFISGWLEPEVKWEAVRELRSLGYQVSESFSAPLHLRVEERVFGDPRYTFVVYLVDRASDRILAQGRGEERLIFVTEEGRLKAKKKAVIAAIRSLQ